MTRRFDPRAFWVWLHRWAGLAMAGFLIVVGATGSLLAFYAEIERALNPAWYVTRAATVLGPGELASAVERDHPAARVNYVYPDGANGATYARVSPRGDAPLGYDEVIVDPATGATLATREFGVLADGWRNLMGFVLRLHYELALGDLGMWALGIAALVWTLDCFVGAYLTLPPRRRQSARAGVAGAGGAAPRPSWWSRWAPAWRFRRRAGGYKLNFDLHRAGGLWLWAALLVFAWSSVYMNLYDTVYTWATRAVMDYRTPQTEVAPRAHKLDTPQLGWLAAQARGRELMAAEAAQHGFTVEREVAMRLDRTRGLYEYRVRSSDDIQDRRGRTRVYFDADSGALKLVALPTGHRAGNTVSEWLYALHMANVFGLPYRIFVVVLGLAIVVLSVTGVVIWAKKRRARRAALRRSAGAG